MSINHFFFFSAHFSTWTRDPPGNKTYWKLKPLKVEVIKYEFMDIKQVISARKISLKVGIHGTFPKLPKLSS